MQIAMKAASRSTVKTGPQLARQKNDSSERRLIAEQNDLFRATWPFAPHLGRFVLSRELASRSGQFQSACLEAVRTYSGFSTRTDPDGTHQAGVLEIDGKKICFSIALFDKTYEMPAADPSDLAKTKRVLTIHASEEH